MIEKGLPIYGFKKSMPWYDLGEVALYQKSLFEILNKPLSWMNDLTPDTSWIHPSSEIMGNVTTRHVIIEEGVTIDEGVIMENTLVFPNTHVKPGHYKNQILF